MDIVELLKRPESKTLEFKRDLSSPEPVLRTLVAFANTAGGVLLIGVDDRNRQVPGVENPLEMEERIANLISDRIAPRLVPDIEILSWRSRSVLGIEVYPSPNRPHRLKPGDHDTNVYVRVGSTNRRADGAIIEEMHRAARGTAFDEQPIPDLDSEALDFRAASELFAPIRKLRRGDLETLKLVTRHQRRLVPTVGGLLLFGTEREEYFPDAWIQVGRFRGTDRAKIVDRSEIRSLPVRAIEETIAFVEKHADRGAEIESVRRRDRWNIPPIAIREAVINSVVHADYSQRGAPIRVAFFDDRIEIENPGLLPFGLTVEDLPRGISKLRNRVIGRVFHALGLIEQWGSGVQRMMAACREAGLPPPQFEEIATRFRVTIATTRTRPVELDEIDRAILECLSDGNGHSTSEIADHVRRSSRATRTRLVRLVELGLVAEVGLGPRDPHRRYFLAE